MASEKGTPPRPRLGRGLSSLISTSASAPAPPPAPPTDAPPAGAAPAPDAPAAAAAAPPPAAPDPRPSEVPVGDIAPNPYQPRREFTEQELAELTASVAQQGILQPLLIARASGPDATTPYVLIAGERRLRAARRAGLATVPCVLRQATPQEMLEWALVENIHRADLNPIERATAYREYMERFSLTQADAAEKLGQARATVANYLRLLDLPDPLPLLIASGTLSFGHAKVLAGLAGQSDRQKALALEVIEDGLSVRELEAIVAEPDPEPRAPARPRPPRPPYLVDVEEQLTRTVGTRVAIRPGRAKNSGRIVIDYYSLDDFDHIVAALGARLES